MKYALVFLWISCFATVNAQAPQELTFAQQYIFTLEPLEVMVKFKPNISNEVRSSIFDPEYFIPFDTNRNKPQFNYAFVSLQNEQDAETMDAIIASIGARPEVQYTSFMYRQPTGVLCAATNSIFVKLKSPEHYAQMMQYVQDNYSAVTPVVTKKQHGNTSYKIECDIDNTVDMFAMANDLFATGYFMYCEPNMVLLTHKASDDTYFDYQWSLNNTGSDIQYSGIAGADVDAVCAWGITKGAGSVVAIIDEGVDLEHEDLLPNLLPGYDAVFSGGGDVENSFGGFEPGSNDAHGTNCTGIVIAVADNGMGVSGIAPESKVAPVRIAYSDSFGWWVIEDAWVEDAIYWSVDTAGADILSNSWGGGAPASVIIDAMQYTIQNGRGGSGALFVAAAGNGNASSLIFPGNNINAIAVGATSMCEERKSLVSCDGENFWGSNYGTTLDVAAPGVKIPSTDISGSAGYSPDDYHLTFNGTSSATPLTAGVLALLLAHNPALTYEQARYILESTCEKVGDYTYAVNGAHPSSTWVNQLGYGQVNACNALEAAYNADIIGEITDVSLDTVHPGELLTVNFYLSNTGWSDAGTFENQFFLSGDCDPYDSYDVPLEIFTTASLAIGETENYSESVTIPESTEKGSKNIVLFANNTNTVGELQINNNVVCQLIYVECEIGPESTELFYDNSAITDTLEITTSSGCDWEITPAAPEWIVLINDEGIGNGNFIFYVGENTEGISRSFTFNNGPNTYTITQEEVASVESVFSAIRIYPNPVSDNLQIIGAPVNSQYHIANSIGGQVASGKLSGTTSGIDVHALPAGVYTLQLLHDGFTHTQSFIKNEL